MSVGKSIDIGNTCTRSQELDSIAILNGKGDLVLDSQGDSELVFIQNPGTANQTVKRLPLGTQVDDILRFIRLQLA